MATGPKYKQRQHVSVIMDVHIVQNIQ